MKVDIKEYQKSKEFFEKECKNDSFLKILKTLRCLAIVFLIGSVSFLFAEPAAVWWVVSCVNFGSVLTSHLTFLSKRKQCEQKYMYL